MPPSRLANGLTGLAAGCSAAGFGANRLGAVAGSAGFVAVEEPPKRFLNGWGASVGFSEAWSAAGFGANRLGVVAGSVGFKVVGAAPKRPPKGLISAGLAGLCSVAGFAANMLLEEVCSVAGLGVVDDPKRFLNGCDVAAVDAASLVAALGAKRLGVEVDPAGLGANKPPEADCAAADFCAKILLVAEGVAFAFSGSGVADVNVNGLVAGAAAAVLGAKTLFIAAFSGSDGVEQAPAPPKREPNGFTGEVAAGS